MYLLGNPLLLQLYRLENRLWISVDPDETTHYEPSHEDLHCLPSCI